MTWFQRMYSNAHKKDSFCIFAVKVFRKNDVLHQSDISVVILYVVAFSQMPI